MYKCVWFVSGFGVSVCECVSTSTFIYLLSRDFSCTLALQMRVPVDQ